MPSPDISFGARLDATAGATEKLLLSLLSDQPLEHEIIRPARLLEAMEAAGVVGPLQPNGSREVLVPGGSGED